MLYIAFDACYAHPLPKRHRFPMIKYELLPKQLLHEGTCTPEQFFSPKPVDKNTVLRVHDHEYYDQLCALTLSRTEVRSLGFPLSEALVHREHVIAQGTIDGAEHALTNGIAMNIAGGTHHAFSDRSEAFCMLNDQAIAAQWLLDNGKANKVLILDLDVHQGNGTAAIFSNHKAVFTFSMHGEKNYPFRKETSDWDIGLPDQTDDNTYLKTLEAALVRLYQNVKPDFVFYLCGVDVIAQDKLGRLGLSLAGCKQRDGMVLQWCRRNDIPVQCSMGGGYISELSVLVEAHANTFRLAQDIYF
jgi:acetoin utilization deacetylase AcuC-like enzyme